MAIRTVDFRSDTVTKPTESMREAMANAEVDDDVLGYDPTAQRLEAKMARTVKNNEDGTMDLDLIEAAIRDSSFEILSPTTRLICLENSHSRSGGRCLSVEYTDKVGDLAKKYGLKLHIDGARIFNASVALGVPVHRLVRAADSVSESSYTLSKKSLSRKIYDMVSNVNCKGVGMSILRESAQACLSKGLGAPAGSVIVGSKSFIARAKILRKTLGGGMRQIGVLCAAASVALQENLVKLEGDHRNAKILTEELNKIRGLKVDIATVETNIEALGGMTEENGDTQHLMSIYTTS
ncbi:putative low-specificity L-threonine aldolase 1 [Capsicum baccatum]|uniref:Low-specificity L-threonine aldolase 1 n=1 Tax=Capsicum baccatum TaxID=33114 RepID=A0A2G2XA90_CAPBA|nr:putative low-specificity L-threonine aldolase 1 [Capsicum baccatum]